MPFLLWFVTALRGENKIKNMSAIFFFLIFITVAFQSGKKQDFLHFKQTN